MNEEHIIYDPFVWDKNALESRVRGKRDRMNRLIALFLEDTPGRLACLEEAINSADLSMVAETAHTVKGVATNLGTEQLRETAEAMEQAARENQAATLSELMPIISEQFKTSEVMMKTFLDAE